MEYKIYLDYTIELLSQIKIPSYIIDTPYTWDNQIDGGLRNNIFTQNTYMNNQENFSQFISSYNRDNTALFIHDSFSCEYIHIKLPDSERIFIAGPFSYERFTNQRILDLCSYNSVPVQYNEFIDGYDKTLIKNNPNLTRLTVYMIIVGLLTTIAICLVQICVSQIMGPIIGYIAVVVI